MRFASGVILFLTGVLALVGCASTNQVPDVPKNEAFIGSLVHDGKPVSFPTKEDVSLQIFHEKGQSMGIPIKPDGSFTIGWMWIGKYSAMLLRDNKDGKSPKRYNVPGGFTVEPGKTQYQIELGSGWKS